jgi:hypothetical protein
VRQFIHCGRCLYIGNWAINRIWSDVVEMRVLCWEVGVDGSTAGSGSVSDVAMATSVLPSTLLPKVVECCRILDSYLT